ncbi:Fc.00g078750.m01.CDS01 [Cosmosporella sp. VM-42]
MMMNLTCNSTLEEMRITDGDEIKILGPLTFHELARVIGASCALIACIMSFFLIWMHAINYTRPREQRQIIRILLMVPVYAISSFFQIQWYWHSVYFQVMSDCYEAFAIASFFALLCHYIAPDLHSQKQFFREMRPVKPWVWPVNWMAKCCAGQRGPWRTPKSGLTWFNIIWIGIYHYCFIRVAMTVTSVVSQSFNKYCESSNSPVFAHIWVLAINCIAVFIAMLCIIQFYIQLREPLAEHKPFTKVLAIKLVVFLAFWQTTCISIGTSTLNLIHPNKVLAYPDLKIGIPALLLCFEMACFSIFHLWAFPYQPYRPSAKPTFYPVPDVTKGEPYLEIERLHPSGGFLGFGAIWDALNLWDFVKAFGRGMRWLFCGVKRRKEDVSYKNTLDMDNLHQGSTYDALKPGQKSTDHLPIATEFRRSTFGMPGYQRVRRGEESSSLIENAQPNPEAGLAITTDAPPVHQTSSPYQRPLREPSPYSPPPLQTTSPYQRPSRDPSPYADSPREPVSTSPFAEHQPPYPQESHLAPSSPQEVKSPQSPHRPPPQAQGQRSQEQAKMGEALWGQKFI